MFIHLSKDIGVADRNLPANIHALHSNWIYMFGCPGGNYKAAYESDNTQLLPFVHAIMLMATARKSRTVDNAITVHTKAPFEEREVPEYAMDWHSPKGKREGRDAEHWIQEASKINNASGIDPWQEKAEEFLRGLK
jgi:hypothetical protein